MRVASERVGPGRIRQKSPFIRVDIVGPASVAIDVRAAGIECVIGDHELTVLWQKLAFLAPLALATPVAAAPLGSVRRGERYLQSTHEGPAVREADGRALALLAPGPRRWLRAPRPAASRPGGGASSTRARRAPLPRIPAPRARNRANQVVGRVCRPLSRCW